MRCKGRFCSGTWLAARVTGALFMLIGLVILLLSLPCWLWAAIFGALLILIGFLLFKIG